MLPLRLIPKNLGAHPVRSLLTLGSLALAVFILCVLQSLLVTLSAGMEAAASNRLIVQSAVSLFVDLPQSYQPKIDQVGGVEQTCKFQWFGGYYQSQENFFAQFAVDADRFFETYPEIELIEGDGETFQRERRACLVGKHLANRFSFKVGQRIPIIGTMFQLTSGDPWAFEVAGIYDAASPNVDKSTMFFHYEYLDEAMRSGAATGPEGVGVYTIRLAPDASATQVMANVDNLFANGPQRVQTTTEKEFQRQFVTMMGNVPTLLGAIGGGVVFAIFLAVLNTMLMAARERTRDLGIMKALGFNDTVTFLLLVVESVFLCLIGALAGVGLAYLSEPVLKMVVGTMFPGFRVLPSIVGISLAGALALGALAGLLPAWRARALRPVEAFRAEI